MLLSKKAALKDRTEYIKANSSSAAFNARNKWRLWHDSASSCSYVEVIRGERLVVVGCAMMRCVKGVADCHGYRLKNGWVRVASYSWQPCVCVRVAPGYTRCVLALAEAHHHLPVLSRVADLYHTKRGIHELFPNCAVLRVRRPKEALAEFGLGASTTPRSWRRAAVEACSNNNVALVCGEKNSGKSTFVRYLVNAALTRGKRVVVVDCDPGQPMRGVPGAISAFAPSKPMLAAAHCEADDTDEVLCQLFLGDVTPRDAPASYASAVARLLESAAVGKNLVIINTCGWTRGLGAELLQSIVSALREPLVYVVGDALSCLEHATVLPEKFQTASTSSAQQKRTLQLAAYFARPAPSLPGACARNGVLVDPHFAFANYLAQCAPYEAPIEHLALAFVGSAFTPGVELCRSQYLPRLLHTMLNGIIVGLASRRDLPGEPLDFDAASFAPCRAFGLVVGFDELRRLVLILTPDPEKLQGCDLLLKGSLATPSLFLYRGPAAASFPYLSCESIGAGLAAPMRSTRANVRHTS